MKGQRKMKKCVQKSANLKVKQQSNSRDLIWPPIQENQEQHVAVAEECIEDHKGNDNIMATKELLTRKPVMVDCGVQTDTEDRPYYSRSLKLAIANAVKNGMPPRMVVKEFGLRNTQVVYNILQWCRKEGVYGVTVQWLVDYLNKGGQSHHNIIGNTNGNQIGAFSVKEKMTKNINRAADNLKTLEEFRLKRAHAGLRLDPESAAKLKSILMQCEVQK